MTISLDPSSKLALAIDIGGTKMRAGIISSEGKLVRRESVLTLPKEGIEGAAQRLIGAIRTAVGQDAIAGMGLASAGPMYPKDGVYDNPPSLHTWHGKTMKPTLESELGIPVMYGHDATLAAFAEYNFGPHKGKDPLIYFTISTGIGGGLVARGEMITGCNGLAGEFGHIIVDPNSDRFCGGRCRGCFESIGSGTSIANKGREMYSSHPDSDLMRKLDGQADKITTAMVFEAAEAGDAIAKEIIDEALEVTSIAFASFLNWLDPAVIIFGGGVSQPLKPLLGEIRKRTSQRALLRFREGVPIHVTTLGDEVSMLGAAAMVFANASKSGR